MLPFLFLCFAKQNEPAASYEDALALLAPRDRCSARARRRRLSQPRQACGAWQVHFDSIRMLSLYYCSPTLFSSVLLCNPFLLTFFLCVVTCVCARFHSFCVHPCVQSTILSRQVQKNTRNSLVRASCRTLPARSTSWLMLYR